METPDDHEDAQEEIELLKESQAEQEQEMASASPQKRNTFKTYQPDTHEDRSILKMRISSYHYNNILNIDANESAEAQ